MKISDPRNIQIENYDYPLDEERIAKYPLKERDSSKLLLYRGGAIADATFKDIPSYLPQDGLMIFNNTKVIHARLIFQKETGARIELFCLEPLSPNDYLTNFQQTERCSWICLIGNAKKWKEGSLTLMVKIGEKNIELKAERLEKVRDANEVEFSWNDSAFSFAEILDVVGELPIPPYLNRKTEESDLETYQTVYSKIIGSVAAPTAGLHFTPSVLAAIKDRGIIEEEVTLHVGAGTFKPVQSKEIGDHAMHSELISVRREVVESLLNNIDRKVIAVGTTSVRTLESLYYVGLILSEGEQKEHLFVPQWIPYEREAKLSKQEALKAILNYLDEVNSDVLIAHTAIIIAPGYEFKIVDHIITNFHQPKSTLLLLVSAFVKDENWKKIYDHALSHDYRFLSYGDSSLLTRD